LIFCGVRGGAADMDFFGALLTIALFVGLCVLGFWYANYATDKERRQYEEAERAEREKHDYESNVRREYLQKENALREKELQLQKEKDQIERNKRFVYDNSVYPVKVSFVKDNFEDVMKSIPAPYLSFIAGITKTYHTAINRVLAITKEEFDEFEVSPNFSVNLAAFLLYYAHSIAWKYDGEFHDVSHSVEHATEKMFLLCGFNEHLDATKLNTEFRLFHDLGFFFTLYHYEINLSRDWSSHIRSRSILINESIKSVFNIFMDVSFLSAFFSSTNYQEVYSSTIDQTHILSITPAQQFFIESIEDFLSDFKNDLLETFEQDFSESNRLEYNAIDNDDLAFIYGYESDDYELHDYYFPYPPAQ
jgi:uncharacterized FlaG/YvyC family protein